MMLINSQLFYLTRLQDIDMIEELPCDQQLPSNDANHHPRYPVEPALRAIDLFHKHRFEYRNYDIMIDE